jgi:O-antigen ligase
LDRAWPLLLAVALFPGEASKTRRWLYGAGLGLVSLTLLLTFSKGALLLGLPAAVIVMSVFYALRNPQQRRRIIMIAAACLALFALALAPLSQTQRFRTAFSVEQGSTGFFRLKLWEASFNMLRDHWPLGVGPDNFLYQYRTRYILPEAWQEPNLSHPHNLVLDFGTRVGLGGIIWLGWAQLIFWRNAWRLYKQAPASLVLGLIGSMAVFLSHGLVDHSFFLVDLAFIFFLTAGIIQKLAEVYSDQPTPS